MTHQSRKRCAFTLAEVLITLAIIGVVAAMTLPVLINKYQDRVSETRYKKAVSMFSQAMQLAMAENETVGNMTHTDLWGCRYKGVGKGWDEQGDCFSAETKKLFKNIVLEGNGRMTDVDYADFDDNPWLAGVAFGESSYMFTTGDGLVFRYIVNEDSGLTMLLDTNGASKPNRVGKDLYALQILPNGKVVDVTSSVFRLSDGSSVASGGGASPEHPEPKIYKDEETETDSL